MPSGIYDRKKMKHHTVSIKKFRNKSGRVIIVEVWDWKWNFWLKNGNTLF